MSGNSSIDANNASTKMNEKRQISKNAAADARFDKTITIFYCSLFALQRHSHNHFIGISRDMSSISNNSNLKKWRWSSLKMRQLAQMMLTRNSNFFFSVWFGFRAVNLFVCVHFIREWACQFGKFIMNKYTRLHMLSIKMVHISRTHIFLALSLFLPFVRRHSMRTTRIERHARSENMDSDQFALHICTYVSLRRSLRPLSLWLASTFSSLPPPICKCLNWFFGFVSFSFGSTAKRCWYAFFLVICRDLYLPGNFNADSRSTGWPFCLMRLFTLFTIWPRFHTPNQIEIHFNPAVSFAKRVYRIAAKTTKIY